MIAPRYVPLVVKQITRHRMRSLLTIAGVATAMFLFAAVHAFAGEHRRAARGDEQQHRRRPGRTHEIAEQEETVGVRPLQIVDDHEERVSFA